MNFTPATGERPVLDIRMEVGDSSQTVGVTAEVPLLDTGTGSVGQVITAQHVEDFQLCGRTPLTPAQPSLGVVATPTGTAVAGQVAVAFCRSHGRHPMDSSPSPGKTGSGTAGRFPIPVICVPNGNGL